MILRPYGIIILSYPRDNVPSCRDQGPHTEYSNCKADRICYRHERDLPNIEDLKGHSEDYDQN